MRHSRLVIVGVLAFVDGHGWAQGDGLRVATRSGAISLAGGAVSLDLPAAYRYAEGADARRVLEEFWGNPGDAAVVGLILPPEETASVPWSMIVSWHARGWVDDRHPLPDPESLLQDLRKHGSAGGAESAVAVLGWAVPPQYDRQRKLLSWGTRLQFRGDALESVNVHHALLLRDGWLQLTTISPVPALEVMQRATAALLPALQVAGAHRHSDFPAAGSRLFLTLDDLVTDRYEEGDMPAGAAAPAADPSRGAWWWGGAVLLALLVLGVVSWRRFQRRRRAT